MRTLIFVVFRSESATAPPNPTSTSSSTTTATPFTCPSPNGNFPNADDCNAYYTCSNNVPIPQVCLLSNLYTKKWSKQDLQSWIDHCALLLALPAGPGVQSNPRRVRFYFTHLPSEFAVLRFCANSWLHLYYSLLLVKGFYSDKNGPARWTNREIKNLLAFIKIIAGKPIIVFLVVVDVVVFIREFSIQPLASAVVIHDPFSATS